MLGEIFLIFSLIILVTRFILFESEGYRWVIADVIMLALIVFGIFFLTFPTHSLQVSNTISITGSTNTITNQTITTSSQAVGTQTTGFTILILFGLIMAIISIVFAIRDMILAMPNNKW